MEGKLEELSEKNQQLKRNYQEGGGKQGMKNS